MKRHHRRSVDRNATLNMVSLMDIFTILVFFLLVNATSAEVLPSPQNINLPDAAAEKQPLRNLVIAVDNHMIRLQGQPVIDVRSAMANPQKTIKPLLEALRLATSTTKYIGDAKGITIMGDREIPYALLKKIMLTCASAKYSNISFAVNQRAAKG